METQSDNLADYDPDAVLDVGETGCGDLILLIFQTMKTLAVGQRLAVVAYDRGAPEDIPAWCRQTGNSLLSSEASQNGLPARFIIQKRSN